MRSAPAPPGEVVRNRFGDCKDKANALVTMAEKLGIRACRVLLNRGGRSDPKFPSWQFNHMLVLLPELPGYPDGLWLDPTDGTTKFGELPPGDEGEAGAAAQSRQLRIQACLPAEKRQFGHRDDPPAPGRPGGADHWNDPSALLRAGGLSDAPVAPPPHAGADGLLHP
ncbi:MAG: hypothetical protein L6W00_02560 [Lentisphaeria bacterium]|nr:MAG: hypothetical protein L6W00_02560 [Lentisphaeria bacterium]